MTLTSRIVGRRAFTLIELLVVVAIVSLLIAILLPAMSMARGQSRKTFCYTTLHNIGLASVNYAHDNKDKFPDQDTLGRHTFRRAPEEIDKTDPRSLPEKFGLAAKLGGYNVDRATNRLTKGGPVYMPGRSDVWICPAAADWMQAYRNTYAFSIAAEIKTRAYNELVIRKRSRTPTAENPSPVSLSVCKTWWVWDNYTAYPGACGWMGPFNAGYSIPEAQRTYPHFYAKSQFGIRTKLTNVLYVDGHVAPHKDQ